MVRRWGKNYRILSQAIMHPPIWSRLGHGLSSLYTKCGCKVPLPFQYPQTNKVVGPA